MRGGEPTRNWLVLYLAFAAALVLLWFERHARLTPTDHWIALVAIILAFFVATWLWLGPEGGI